MFLRLQPRVFWRKKAWKKFDKTLLSCGGKLSFGFIVHMPNNGVVTDQMTTKRNKKEIEQHWNAKLQKIAELVKNQQQGRIEQLNFFSDSFSTVCTLELA
jgi:hypothetical protein